MNCQVRRVATLCILPTFPCPGKGFEGYPHELDVECTFRLPYEKSFILPAENCGMWAIAAIPYLELVGDPELDDQDNPERNRINRLAQKVFHRALDGFFGEHNDVVIGISSMAKGLRGGGYPAVTTQMLTCDHFHYYDLPQSLDAVKRWIQAAEKS
jgi:hypothetical protein